MSGPFAPTSQHAFSLVLSTSLLLSGLMEAAATAQEFLSRSPERGGIGLELQLNAEDPEFIQAFDQPLREDLKKLDERLSIIVTDKASTSAITFSDIMQNLADDMRVDKLTLFRSWWDTANDKPDNVFCNSTNRINGFPYQCPRKEGGQAALDPFDCADVCAGYTAIAFSNRFDLADKDRGQHCGEFRIVFARNSGFGAEKNCHEHRDRNLIIFEALVPNPRPPYSPVKPAPENIFVNLAGCRPIVEFWLGLSEPAMSTTARGTALRDFFLKGLPYDGVGPVVDARNYAGGPASGQIRTNQFMEQGWTLREFKTLGGRIVPTSVKSNPGNSLFSDDRRKIELANYLVRKDTLDLLRGLKSPKGLTGERSVFTFAFGLTAPGLDHLNSFESDADERMNGDVLFVYEDFHDCSKNPNCIEKKLTDALLGNSPLNAENIIRRIRTQTCAGCHHYSNGDAGLGIVCPDGWAKRDAALCFFDRNGVHLGIWPQTLGQFTHVSEVEVERGKDNEVSSDFGRLERITPDTLRRIRSSRISHLDYEGPDGEGKRYRISNTLKLVLMPPRFENMILYLNEFHK